MNSLQYKHQWIENLLWGFLLLYPWYMVITGIDLTDTGHWLTRYKYFFSDPESMIRSFPVWLSLVIGASIHSIFSEFGLIVFKAIYVVITYAILSIVYLLLHRYTDRLLLLFSLAVALLLINIDRGYILTHNILTIFVYYIVIFFIYSGLTRNRNRLLFIAGILLGINVFIRLPNLLGIGFILAIIYFDFIRYRIDQHTMKKVLLVVSGYVIAILSILVVMKLIGHYDYYIEGLRHIVRTASDTSMSHSTHRLLDTLIHDYSYAFGYGTLFVITILSIAWVCRLCTSHRYIFIPAVLILSILTALYIMKISHVFDYWNYFYLHQGIFGVYFIFLLFILFQTHKIRPDYSTLVLLSLLITMLISLGSDTHLRKSISGMYLGLPLIFIYFGTTKELHVHLIKLNESSMRFLRTYLPLTLILFSVITSTFYFAAYCDSPQKYKMVHSVKHPLLSYNLTTKQRARTLTDVSMALQRYEKGYTYLFTYNRIPLIQYLSNLKPYIDNPTPQYDAPKVIEEKLKRSLTSKTLPLVVIAKTNTFQKSWPAAKLSEAFKQTSTSVKMDPIIDHFLEENHYIKIWENSDFKILVPITSEK